MKEIWKDIKDFEGLYQISNLGRIKSLLDNKGKKREIIRKPRKAKNGYLYLNLWNNGKYKTVKIHRLVAEYFIDNVNELPVVNHIDGNKLNNSANNLEWCTYKQNTIHAYKNGLLKSTNFFKKRGRKPYV